MIINIIANIAFALAIILILAIAFAIGVFLPSLARAQDSPAAQPSKPAPRMPALDSDETWQQLPRQKPPLPIWARTLARRSPRTTGAMFELDYLHRAGSIRAAQSDFAGEIRLAGNAAGFQRTGTIRADIC
jgi:hypothetical protein